MWQYGRSATTARIPTPLRTTSLAASLPQSLSSSVVQISVAAISMTTATKPLVYGTTTTTSSYTGGDVDDSSKLMTSRNGRLLRTLSSPTVQPISSSRHHHRHHIIRTFASWQGHGTDLLSDSLDHQGGGDPLPKIILKAYGTTGIDVVNSVKNMDPNDEELTNSGGVVHYTSSILAFPTSCFLWNVRSAEQLTMESLTPVILYQPSLEYLFIGTTSREIIPPYQLKDIKDKLEQQIISLHGGKKNVTGRNNLVVEQMDLVRGCSIVRCC